MESRRAKINKQMASKVSPLASADSSNDQDEKDRLDRELLWCIEQLRVGLTDKKATPKQISDATKLLHSLENPATPVPKKRMLMKSTFGDYRKKMADELKQIDSKMKSESKKSVVKPVSKSEQSQSSIFYRKSFSSSESSPATSAQQSAFYADTNAFTNANPSSFSFGFESSTSAMDSDTPASEATESHSVENPQQTKPYAEEKPCLVMTECFRSSPAGSNFSFNFADS